MIGKKTDLLFIDFDSTFIKSEGLEELAKISLQHNPQRDEIILKIQTLTNLAMEGKMDFEICLTQRLTLIKPSKAAVEKTARVLGHQVTESIKHNRDFFIQNSKDIYIISSGFKEFIVPIATLFGISESHVFANTFLFDESGNFKDIDRTNPLSQKDGKVKLVKSLNLKGNVTIIGDGYTDYQLKEKGLATEYIAFTENVHRESVVSVSDKIARSFDEFLYERNLPRAISYPKNRIKVLVLENIDQSAVSIFSEEGYEVKQVKGSIPESELLQEIKDTTILCIRSRTTVTKAVLENARHLLAIGIFAIGTNQVDLEAAANKGISVFNAPYSNIRSVVELVIGEMIMLSRNIFDKSLRMHQGIWEKSSTGLHEIKGKTLGIIGYGNIGTQVSIVAESMGMHVIAFDKIERPAIGNVRFVDLKELLKTADFITLHVDGAKNNALLLSEKEFKMMKEGVIIINASRGFVIDIESLVKYLTAGKIRGAGIDVFPQEPRNNDTPFVSKLQQMQNVILTPHLGGSTEEAQQSIARFVSLKLIEYVNTGNTQTSVNLPNIVLPKQLDAHRLLHLHKNVPGVLSQINGVLSKNNHNIIGQYLKTDAYIGYVITDVTNAYNKVVIEDLKKIPETLKLRVLY